MTFVETAIQKAKDLASARSGIERRSHGEIARKRSTPAPPKLTPPEVPIKPHEVSLNVEQCRENRLLLGPSQNKVDEGATAAYRILRTRILHRARTKQWTTIGVTSAGPNDGKTLTAMNLCLSLARENNSSIVLLDLDMRNPSVCRTFGVAPPHQLHHALEGRVEFKDLFLSVGIPNLIIAGNTVASENASELLSSPRFEELIEFIRTGTSNPLVMIDLPPVLSTDDALVIAPRIDAILLIVSEGKTDRASVIKAVDQLSEFRIAGMVLNRALDTSREYGYGYGAAYGAS